MSDMDGALQALVGLEVFYRQLGLLDRCHAFTQRDVLRVGEVLAGVRPADELSLGQVWLLDAARRWQGEADSIELIARYDGVGVARWYPEDYSDYEHLLPLLAAASGGALPLHGVRADVHMLPGGEEFLELECVVGETRCGVWMPWRKYGCRKALLVEVNRWIADSGRRFGLLLDHFVCVDREQEGLLIERGLALEVPVRGEFRAQKLVPLLDYLLLEQNFERVVDITTWSPALCDAEPELEYARGAALLAMGDEAQGWAAMARAASAGVERAREYLARR